MGSIRETGLDFMRPVTDRGRMIQYEKKCFFDFDVFFGFCILRMRTDHDNIIFE